MIDGRHVLAVVPARSGSRGIPDKNMQRLQSTTLIALAGQALAAVPFIDVRVISTDSPSYADEGRRAGLEAPFLRPLALSGDDASSIAVCQHALAECELRYQRTFDIILIVEPTSPLRIPADIERVARKLVDANADSVVSVSRVSTKFHPLKLLVERDGRLQFLHDEGAQVVARQELTDFFYCRNGVAYALTRDCLTERQAVFTERTLAEVIERPVANIDDPIDLLWADFLLARRPGAAMLDLDSPTLSHE